MDTIELLMRRKAVELNLEKKHTEEKEEQKNILDREVLAHYEKEIKPFRDVLDSNDIKYYYHVDLKNINPIDLRIDYSENRIISIAFRLNEDLYKVRTNTHMGRINETREYKTIDEVITFFMEEASNIRLDKHATLTNNVDKLFDI